MRVAMKTALTAMVAAVVLGYSAAAAVGDITSVATVTNPAGLACDLAGNLFICDPGSHVVRRLNVTTGVLSVFAGTGVAGSTGDGGAATSAQLNQPTGVLVDRAGNVYIAEFAGHRVRKVDALTGLISLFAGNGSATTTGDGGAATSAGVRNPTSVHMNAAGDLFIAQNGGSTENRVRRVTGGIISTVAGGGVAVPANGVAAASVSIQFQQGGNYIHVDLAGNLYIADELLNIVYRVSPAGIITIVGGNTTSGFSGDGGAATAAAIDDPTSIGVDLTGTIFVSNSAGQSRIRRIDGGSGIITSVAGTGTNGFSGDGGPATAAQIATTTGFGGVCIDVNGNVFFSDFNNNRVRRIQGAGFGTPPPGPLPTFIATGSVGAPFVYNLPSSGPFSPTPTGLPPGLTVAGGVVSGTPTLDGTFSVTFTSGSTNFVVVFLISPSGVSTGAGQNGGGPNPIPRFIALPNGGTSPVTVIFNPAASYLPVSTTPNQINYYQAIYDFGDGTPNLVIGPPTISVGLAAPATNAAAILAPVSHVYVGDQLYNVTLTINVFVASVNPATNLVVEGPLTGPSGVNTGVVRLAQVNFAPGPLIQNNGSQANGEVPFTLTVTPSFGFDEDGYIIWAAIDWGDGTAELIRNPPTLPTVPTNHVYAVSGIYKVTVSVIDNGRIPLGTTLPSLPDPRDPIAALAFFKNFQASLSLATFGPQFFNLAVNPRAPLALDPKFDPTLRQDFLLVQVTDNLVGIKGKFQLDFAKTQRDTMDLTVKSNVQLDKVAGETVVVSIGVGTTAVTQTFVADRRGRFRADGFTFGYDAKKQLIRIKFSKAQLATALGVANATVANGNTDVRLTVTVGTRTLSTTLRFSYVSDQGNKAKGKGGISKDAGN